MTDQTDSYRRRAVLLAGAAGAASLAGCGDPFGAYDSQDAGGQNETLTPRLQGEAVIIRLAARDGQWDGIGPSGIEGDDNPTLTMNDGEDYVIVWENLDGDRHQFALLDSQGNEIASTEPSTEYGRIRSVEVIATEDIAEYYCPFHPETMRGDVQIR